MLPRPFRMTAALSLLLLAVPAFEAAPTAKQGGETVAAAPVPGSRHKVRDVLAERIPAAATRSPYVVLYDDLALPAGAASAATVNTAPVMWAPMSVSAAQETFALAWDGQLTPGGGALGLQAAFSPASISGSDRVAFFSNVSGTPRNQGVFLADGKGGLRPVATGCGPMGGSGQPGGTCGDPSPLGGSFSGFFPGTVFTPDVNSRGDVLFLADVTGGSSTRGLFLQSGRSRRISKVAAVGDADTAGGQILAVGPGSLNDCGEVVFLARTSSSPGAGVYRWASGSLSSVALAGEPAPGGGTYADLGTETLGFADGTTIPSGPAPDINNLGEVAFRALLAGGVGPQAIILSSGSVQRIALAAGDPAPGGGWFIDFFAPILDDAGRIAFFADAFAEGGSEVISGWFTGDTTVGFRKVVALGDSLDGGLCNGLAVSRNPMQPFDGAGGLVIWCDVLLPGGGSEQRLLLASPDGGLVTAARQGEPAPMGGLFGSLQPWPSANECAVGVSADTPGAPSGAVSAHMLAPRGATQGGGRCVHAPRPLCKR